MMSDFKRSTEKVGLQIDPEKTKFLSNQESNKSMEVTTNNIKVGVLPVNVCAKYLGLTIPFEQQETTEIKSRIRAAWATFTKYKLVLTSKLYLLRNRFLLFSMVITPTLTYASGTWTLSQEHEKLIRSRQRKMTRLIVQTNENTRRMKIKTRLEKRLNVEKILCARKRTKRTIKTSQILKMQQHKY